VDDCIGRLGEKEGRFAVRIEAHFARVFGVVATNAEYAANREKLIRSGHMNMAAWLGRENVIGHDVLGRCQGGQLRRQAASHAEIVSSGTESGS
jgi:hypothetical protein